MITITLFMCSCASIPKSKLDQLTESNMKLFQQNEQLQNRIDTLSNGENHALPTLEELEPAFTFDLF